MSDTGGFRERLRAHARLASRGESQDLWRYREAASVLAAFDLQKLRPLGTVSSSSVQSELLADCDALPSPEGTMLWMLRVSVRQAALRRLISSNSIEAALALNPDRPESDAQRMLELYLRGGSASPEMMSRPADQRALLAVADWLGGVSEFQSRLPSLDELKDRIAWGQLLQPFRDLAGEHFAGRASELAQLSDYVGFFASHGSFEAVDRAVEFVFNITDRPPLFVNGPGGCGKSTLIARFVLDHVEIEDSRRFPFAYLDFDRPGLLPEEPITLLSEIMRQLAIQFPESQARHRELSDAWSERVLAQTDSATDDSPRLWLADRIMFLDELALFVNSLKNDRSPLLLVLDTFEEVQFRGASFADEILDLLNLLQARVPRLRTVLSGRADIRSSRYAVRKLALGNFDEDAAVAFLMAQGIGNPKLAATLFDQVGGSPLVLRLAVKVAELEKVDQSGIDKLPSSWFSIFQTESIEVVLYKRILSHVRDPRVQQLAYPGLVLREITPEVIVQALAKPCGVEVTSMEDARRLAAIMRDQLSTILIPSAGDEERLIHRPDMRRILLQDLARWSSKNRGTAIKLAQIHEAAIAWYSKRGDDPAARAEEIYHRLALGFDRKALSERWIPGLNPYLGSSISELPPERKIYLAARLDIELPDTLWQKADDEDWMLYARRTGQQKLDVGKPHEALTLLATRSHLMTDGALAATVEKVAMAVFHDFAVQYESTRTKPAGPERTYQMNALVDAIQDECSLMPSPRDYCASLFGEARPGTRIVAIALALFSPAPAHMNMAIEVIGSALSPFEQYHALRLANATLSLASPEQRRSLRDVLEKQRGVPIHPTDASRTILRDQLLKKLNAADRPTKK